MNYRIKQSDIEALALRINQAAGTAETPWTKTEAGPKANVGNYHLSGAYGGVSLHQMSNESGGVRDVFSCGHVPKRSLFDRMHAYLRGLEETKLKVQA